MFKDCIMAHGEQLHRLEVSFSRGSITRQEYEDLLSFVASPTVQSPSQQDATQQPHAAVPMSSSPHSRRSVHFVEDVRRPDPMESPLQYQLLAPIAAPSSGLHLRCAACGSTNDTARGPRCHVCHSRLTIADDVSVQAARRNPQTRGRVEPACSSFSMSEDGQLVIQDGFFSCLIQDTATVPPVAKGGGVKSLSCAVRGNLDKLSTITRRRLKPRGAQKEVGPLHVGIHATVSSQVSPEGSLGQAKQGLMIYMPRLLEMCADAAYAQPMHELDEFLDIGHQIHLFRSSGGAAAPAGTRSFSTMTHADVPRLFVQSMAPPMDETELAQAEGAVRLLAEAVRHARGDVRGNGTIQHHLDMGVHLALRVQRSADVDNPFVNAGLIPRAMQCEENLERVVAMYNDTLLAVSGVLPSTQHHVQHPEPNVQASASAA